MTSFHLLPPYHQPLCVQRLAARLLQATYLENVTLDTMTPADDHPHLDWSSISSNIIATVLGGALLAVSGGVLYIAWQVPRQQDQILYNQVEMKQSLQNITTRMQELERNDRRQDADIIRQQRQ